MVRILLAILLSLIAFLPDASAQEESFSEEKWQKLTEGIDYSHQQKKTDSQEKTDQEPNANERTSERNYSGSGGTVFEGMGMIFLIIAGVVILALIIFILANVKSNPALAQQNVEIQEIENIEERIHEVNLDDLFGRFVAGGEYNLALRMSFLMIIKILSEQKLIKWEKQKTNWEYHGELEDFDLRTGFGSMINTFERIWYGEQVITEPEFHYIEAEFNQFKSRLGGE